LYATLAGKLCTMLEVCPCKSMIKCLAFWQAAQLLWSVTDSICQWNTVQDMDPPNFNGFTMMVLVAALPLPPCLICASTASRTHNMRILGCTESLPCLIASATIHYCILHKDCRPAIWPLPWQPSTICLLWLLFFFWICSSQPWWHLVCF
jgi:hypothetical protein